MIPKTISIILPHDIISLLNMIEQHNYEAYVVGGAVRDSILGRTINDYDIATSATPEQIIEIFKDYKVIPTGICHGTVTIVNENINIDITTFRSDGKYTDHRRPDNVQFVESLEKDLARRDFTINALACDKYGNVIDYYGGISDLSLKIIKCVGDPYKRFEEDALRIFRALRFSAQLSFQIEAKTSQAMIELRQNLNAISGERIRVELNKMMRTNYAMHLSQILLEYKSIMQVIIPELKDCTQPIPKITYHDPIIYNHLCHVVGYIDIPDHILRLAAYLHDIGKPATFAVDENNKITFYNHDIKGAEIAYNILKRLKYYKDEINEIILLIRYHNDPTRVDVKWVRRKLNKFNGDDQKLRKLFILKLADVQDHKFFKTWQYNKFNQLNELVDQILNEDQCFTLKKLNVNGYDIMQLGFQGKEIGQVLNLLLKAVMDEQVENNRDALIKFITQKKYKKLDRE